MTERYQPESAVEWRGGDRLSCRLCQDAARLRGVEQGSFGGAVRR